MKNIIYSIGIFLFPFLTFGQALLVNSQEVDLGEDIITCDVMLLYIYDDGSIERLFIKE